MILARRAVAILVLAAAYSQSSLCAAAQLYRSGKRALATAEDHFRAARRTRARYAAAECQESSCPCLQQRSSTKDFDLTDYLSALTYFTELSIGTPPQAFSMAVDTGAADILVMGKPCTSDGCSSFVTLYDPTASSTSKNSSSSGQTNTLFFASGSVTGYIFTDVIALDEFNATAAQFLFGTSLSDGISTSTSPLPVSGLLGLAFGGVSGLVTTLTPFWKAVADSGQMESPEISLYFARALATATGQQEAPGGTLTFGGTNTSLYSGDIEFLNLTGKAGTYWSLDVVSVSVQGTHFLANTTTHRATFDSGASAIGGPVFDVAKIWAAVPGSNTIPSQDGFYSYPCNTTLNISISFGGRAWPIDPADMNLGTVDSDSSQCVGGIYALSSSEADEIFSSSTTGSDRPSWMLGIVFLKNVYTVLRHIPPSIGLAELSTLAGGKGNPNSTESSGSPTATSSVGSQSGTSSQTAPTKHARTVHNIGAILGGVLGGAVFLAIFIAWFQRGHQHRKSNFSDAEEPPMTKTTGERTDEDSDGVREQSHKARLQPLRRVQLSSATMVQPNVSLAASTLPTGEPTSLPTISSDALRLEHTKEATETTTIVDSSDISPILPSSPPVAFDSTSNPRVQPPLPSPPMVLMDASVLRELQILRDEVRRLAEEREAPPSYEEGG